jgi:hypothetical protein
LQESKCWGEVIGLFLCFGAIVVFLPK